MRNIKTRMVARRNAWKSAGESWRRGNEGPAKRYGVQAAEGAWGNTRADAPAAHPAGVAK